MKYTRIFEVILAYFFLSIIIPKPCAATDQSLAQPATASVAGKLSENKFVTKEIAIGQLRSGYAEGSIAFAQDGSCFAYACGPQGRQQMIIGDSAGEIVVFCSVPQFSPVNNELYYFAIRQNAPGQMTVDLMAGEKRITTDFTPGAGTLVFSSNGKHYAAIGGKVVREGRDIKPAGVSLIIDGKMVGTYKDVSSPEFSSDGASNAFFVLNNDETMSLFVDSKIHRTFKKPEVPCSFIFNTSVAGPNLDGMVKMHFMPDGRLSYLVRDERGWSVYIDDKRVASYGLVIWGGPGGNIHTLVYDGSDKDSAIMANSFVAAKSSATIAWWSRSEGKDSEWRILVNGEARDKHVWSSDIQRFPPKLSVDAKHIAYAASRRSASGSEEFYVIHDSNQYGPYDGIFALAISDDGSRIAYAAKTAENSKLWNCYLNGNKCGESFTWLYRTQIAADGSAVAWSGEREGKAIAVINGIPLASGDEVLFGPVFGGDGSPKWILRRDNDLIQVTATLH